MIPEYALAHKTATKVILSKFNKSDPAPIKIEDVDAMADFESDDLDDEQAVTDAEKIIDANDPPIENVDYEKEDNDDDKDENIVAASKKAFLRYYGLETVSFSTVCRWMRILGMKYCERKKNYYVDGHERADNVKYRKKYITKYFQDERQMYRWVQIPLEEYNSMVRVVLFYFNILII